MDQLAAVFVGFAGGVLVGIILVTLAVTPKTPSETRVVLTENPPGYEVKCQRVATYDLRWREADATISLSCAWVRTDAPPK